jgi:hypothetical protein
MSSPLLARVTGRRDKACIGSKPDSTLEGIDLTHDHQKLYPEDRSQVAADGYGATSRIDRRVTP